MPPFDNVLWKPLPIETYKHWVDAILEEASEDLNEWQSGFIASIKDRLDKNITLTERQAIALESIYVDKVI
jgi:hypothetical protein